MGGIDTNTLAAATVLAFSILTWLYTQLQSASRNQRAELRGRRKWDAGRTVYIFRLEEALRERGVDPLPAKPNELIALEEEEADWR